MLPANMLPLFIDASTFGHIVQYYIHEWCIVSVYVRARAYRWVTFASKFRHILLLVYMYEYKFYARLNTCARQITCCNTVYVTFSRTDKWQIVFFLFHLAPVVKGHRNWRDKNGCMVFPLRRTYTIYTRSSAFLVMI